MANTAIMKILKTTLKVTATTLGIMFIAFFVYANLEKPSLGEQIYMSNPTGIAVLEIEEGATASDIAQQLSTIEGVTSHTYIQDNHSLIVTYSKNETDRQGIISSLMAAGTTAIEKTIESNKPQCPVHGYLDAFYTAKYALNIRK